MAGWKPMEEAGSGGPMELRDQLADQTNILHLSI
jgi:hypothetical protein